MFDVTVFYTNNSKSKVPISPYDDGTFVFETVHVETKDEIFRVMVHNFILNVPKDLKEPIRCHRRKSEIGKFNKKSYNYVVIDCDDIYSQENRDKVLEFFKKYNCIIGESRCADKVENFNLKGVLLIEETNFEDLKWLVAEIHDQLQQYCTIDEAVARSVSLNCPIKKYDILLDSDGVLYRYKNTRNLSISKQAKIYELTKLNSNDFQDLEADSIDQLCLKVFQKMGFQAMSVETNNVIRFKHPSEKKTPGGYYWFSTSPYIMHHFNASKTISIYDQVRQLSCAKDLISNAINYDDVLKRFNVNTKVIQVNEKYLTVSDKVKQSVNDFLNNDYGLFSIRSPMGTGKSNIIGYIIQEAQENDLRVLIITNRISVAEDFNKKYGLKLYNNRNYSLGDSLICQFDSLRKYDLKFFDLVIMDEFISLMTHSRTAINSNAFNISKFFMAFNKKLVIADAFLTGYENFLLDEKTSNLWLLDNRYRDPTPLYLYKDKNYFLVQMLSKARKHQITVSVTSISFAKSLQKLFEKNNLRTIMLTAETSEHEKDLIYKLFEQSNNDKWDVLIYSPTLTVGVSNLNNTYYHFHYDSSSSANVISSIQMIKRTRKAKEIHMYIAEKIKYVRTEFDDLRDKYLYEVGKASETNYLFEINAYGEPRLSKIGEKCIKIDCFNNILEYNHLSGFMFMAKYHFLNNPAVIEDKFDHNILNIYHQQMLDDKHNNIDSTVDQYINLQNNYEMLKELKLENLADVDAQLYSVQEKPNFSIELRKELLKNYLKDKKFIKKCKFYKIFKELSLGLITKDDIRIKISQIIMYDRANVDDIEVLNDMIKCNEKNLQDIYPIIYVKNKERFKKLLLDCGYMVYNKDVDRFGERNWEICREVKQFSEFVRD